MSGLGRIERIKDLRSVWAHEALDFTKWLGKDENLKLLAEAVGIDILLEEMESAVGAFNVDIFATEEVTGRRIIIENQLEDTDHDHLGKIITYASGKNAEVIIWVVKRARDEHRQAVEWLNQHTDENIGFFLLEIELWKIDESKPAVKFNVVERPNDWAKTMKSQESLSETKKLQLEYWENLVDKIPQHAKAAEQFTQRKAHAQHWHNFSVGTSQYNISLTISFQKKKISAGLYIYDNKEIFHEFKKYENDIAKILGQMPEWKEANKACRISCTETFNFTDNENELDRCIQWHLDMALRFKEVCKKYGV